MTTIVRREFLVAAGGLAATFLVGGNIGAQGQPPQTNFGPMDQSAYRPTYRPAKPGATPLLSNTERDALEKRLKCQCTCILDVYTCRTTDFTCPVSPAMHQDVMRLVEGGYSGDEILAAFVETYGEVALTSPKKEGFNWAGYFAPAIAMMTGAVVLTMMLRRWAAESRVARASSAATASAADAPPPATDAEMERLNRVLRDDR